MRIKEKVIGRGTVEDGKKREKRGVKNNKV